MKVSNEIRPVDWIMIIFLGLITSIVFYLQVVIPNMNREISGIQDKLTIIEEKIDNINTTLEEGLEVEHTLEIN